MTGPPMPAGTALIGGSGVALSEKSPPIIHSAADPIMDQSERHRWMTWLDCNVHDCADPVRALFRAKGLKMTLTSDGSPNIIAAFGAAITLNILEYTVDPEAHARGEGGFEKRLRRCFAGRMHLALPSGICPRLLQGRRSGDRTWIGADLSRETADMLSTLPRPQQTHGACAYSARSPKAPPSAGFM